MSGFAFGEDRMPEPPDLQVLVRKAGGYHRITAEQWASYDFGVRKAQEWLAAHHKVCKRKKHELAP